MWDGRGQVLSCLRETGHNPGISGAFAVETTLNISQGVWPQIGGMTAFK